MKLIQNIDVYAPQHLGKKDVLIINDKIVKIKDAGSISADGFLSETERINGEGLLLTPGFIDSHVHVLGGGGEGGFANRTPEATMEGLTKFGVTTVVGCLGTDGIGRDMCALVAKTKGLNEQGMSAYCYTGSYQIPVRTLTDSIVKDIMMIQEIIGTGEIAISDHRSSQPTFEEFARVIAAEIDNVGVDFLSQIPAALQCGNFKRRNRKRVIKHVVIRHDYTSKQCRSFDACGQSVQVCLPFAGHNTTILYHFTIRNVNSK